MKEKVSPKHEPSTEKKREEPKKQQGVETKEVEESKVPLQRDNVAESLPVKPPTPPVQSEREAVVAGTAKKGTTEKSPAHPPALPKEDPSPRTIGVKQEDKKEHILASNVLNQFNAGVSFYNQREISKAILAYQKVVEMDPSYVEAYNNLGIIYQEMDDLENAFKAYRKALEINPQYEKAFNNLGILFYTSGRYEEAVEAFGKALAINPNNLESHINLGVLLKKQGHLGKAIESFQKALAINPLHGEIHYNIALLYEQLGNVDLAIGHHRRFIQLASKTHPELVSKVEKHLDYLVATRRSKR